VTMPEAAVHEDRDLARLVREIWCSGKSLHISPHADTKLPKYLGDLLFWRRIGPAYPLHQCRPQRVGDERV